MGAPIGVLFSRSQVSGAGQVQGFYTDIAGRVIASVSSADEHDGKLWMGNLQGDYVSFIELDRLSGHASAADAAGQTHAEL